MSAEEVAEMEAKVEELRPSKPKKQAPTHQSAEAAGSDSSTGATQSHRKQKSSPSNQADRDDNEYVPGMRVPNSVLKECNDSFTAADDRRVKASTLFFADTGLMAILCRHDRVLWLVNMTSAGEKQYYALTLLQKLFQHVPRHFRAGVLYDVGCQLDLSCKKYGFLASFIDRIIFAISVFHAYGHNWLCQIIYHPRKCPGFGLSDGEGCERFWSLIKSLIPICRVSGYFTRLYTIDTQVKHLDESSLLNLGSWLKRKWLTMVEIVSASGVGDDVVELAVSLLLRLEGVLFLDALLPLEVLLSLDISAALDAAAAVAGLPAFFSLVFCAIASSSS